MAQSVERFTRNEQVISSNLITSSKNKNVLSDVLFFIENRTTFSSAVPFSFSLFLSRSEKFYLMSREIFCRGRDDGSA